jgi:hypothetical protein
VRALGFGLTGTFFGLSGIGHFESPLVDGKYRHASLTLTETLDSNLLTEDYQSHEKKKSKGN